MKKLIIPSNGMPFQGDDLTYLTNGMVEALEATVHPFLKDGHIILSGITSTLENDGTTTLSPGWIVIDNEIMEFDGGNISGGDLTQYSLKKQVTYDPLGNEVFADNIERDTYEIVKAAIVFGEEGGVVVSELSSYRLNLQPEIKYTLVEDDNNKLYARKIGNHVFIHGTLTNNDPDLPVLNGFNVLPNEFRPLEGLLIQEPFNTENEVSPIITFAIPTSGVVSIFIKNGLPDPMPINQINYFVD